MRRPALLLLALLIAVSTATFFIGRATSPPGPRTSSTVTTTPLELPDVREDFTLLPCAKATTIGLEGCAEHRVLSLDHRIDQLAQEVLHLLPGATAKRGLVRAASEWAIYRRLTCSSAAAA
jgi:hypothetical protein